MSNFEKCFEKLILIEGGYVNDSYDSGGETKYGITKNTARKNGYMGSMKDLPLSVAKDVYKKNYWDINKLDEINNENIQEEIFDTGVNCGTSTAIKFIQKAFNILSPGSPLTIDGKIGKNTLNAINNYKYPNRLLKLANAYQVKHYLEITEKNEKNEKFIFGWLDNRVKV